MQKINIKLKRLGKRKINKIDFEIEKSINNLEDLIREIVKSEVLKFNNKLDNPLLVSFLTTKEIEDKSKEGKVSFGENYNQDKAIESEAIENALLSFLDGVFVVFIDDEEIKNLKQNITITEQSEVVFLRLTFLTGRYW